MKHQEIEQNQVTRGSCMLIQLGALVVCWKKSASELGQQPTVTILPLLFFIWNAPYNGVFNITTHHGKFAVNHQWLWSWMSAPEPEVIQQIYYFMSVQKPNSNTSRETLCKLVQTKKQKNDMKTLIVKASSHNAQGVIDGRWQVWPPQHQTGAQYSEVECTRLEWLFAMLLLQHPSQGQQVTSRVRRVSAFCEVTEGVIDFFFSLKHFSRFSWDILVTEIFQSFVSQLY